MKRAIAAAGAATILMFGAQAVMMAVRRLKRDGLVRVDRKGHLSLSPPGAVSEEFERRLIAVLGDDKPCPHGHLPGQESEAERRRLGWVPLDELEPGRGSVVASVFERDSDLLAYLNDLGVRAGSRLRVVSRNCDQTLSLRMGRRELQLGNAAAAKIRVRPY
jgi:Fe2+ transport system protein FeoA